MCTLPDDVRNALLKAAKELVLSHYIGGRKRLEQWNGFYAHLTRIHSFDLLGTQARNLRRLAKLAEAGVLIELPRSRATGVRRFTAPRHVLEEIGQQAVQEWVEIGYRVGEMMDEVKRAAHGIKGGS